MHMRAYTSQASTIESTFKLHLGTIFSLDYNLGRLKMTIKTLFYKTHKQCFGSFQKVAGYFKRARFFYLPHDSLEISVILVPVATTEF